MVGGYWFTEGFADWVSAKVLNELGWQDYATTLHRARQELIRHRELLPMLSGLATTTWARELDRPKGRIRTYSLALLAVDRLIQRKGLSATIEYLKSGKFEESFGMSREDYTLDFDKYISELPGPGQTRFSVQRPDWKIGNQWVYAEKRPGSKITGTKQITIIASLCG